MDAAVVSGIKLYPWRICYVEDSPEASTPIKLGMEVLLDAEVDLFRTTNRAKQAFDLEGIDRWNVFVFDNRTGFDSMTGLELAQEVKKRKPDALVVSLNSSDMQELADYGLEKLKGEGIEFWYKLSESFLMITWFADCAKQGRMIPREEWLESIGEKTQYIGPYDETRESDKAIRMQCLRMRDSINPALKGVLMKKNTKLYLDEITPKRKGLERI